MNRTTIRCCYKCNFPARVHPPRAVCRQPWAMMYPWASMLMPKLRSTSQTAHARGHCYSILGVYTLHAVRDKIDESPNSQSNASHFRRSCKQSCSWLRQAATRGVLADADYARSTRAHSQQQTSRSTFRYPYFRTYVNAFNILEPCQIQAPRLLPHVCRYAVIFIRKYSFHSFHQYKFNAIHCYPSCSYVCYVMWCHVQCNVLYNVMYVCIIRNVCYSITLLQYYIVTLLQYYITYVCYVMWCHV